MQVEQVADGFRERARQFLHVRETVEFQRIELAGALGRGALVARHHLGFGFHVHLAQLLFQALDGGIDILQIVPHGAHLLFEP